MTSIFGNFEFRFGFSMLFYTEIMYYLYFTFTITKVRKDPHKCKIPKNACQIRNVRIFLPRKLVSFLFCIILSLNLGKTQQKYKILRKTSQIRNLRIFLPRNDVSFVFFPYLSLKFEKPRKDPHKCEIPRKTSQIRIPRGRFRGYRLINH